MNTFAITVASSAIVPHFATTVANFFPDIKIHGANSASSVRRQHPDAILVDVPVWETPAPKHYLCIVTSLSWAEIEAKMLLAPSFMKELVSKFGSARVGTAHAEENQYLFYSAELLSMLGATRALHEAFKKTNDPTELQQRMNALLHEDARRQILEDVLGLKKGSYESYLASICDDLVEGI